jgi:hypothetical protein
MSDTTTPEAKNLNAKRIKRRIEKIQSGNDAGKPEKNGSKMRGKLAISILRQIAAGKIANPTAAAKAFVTGLEAGVSEKTGQ